MLLTIESVDSESSRESDYDTAVDLVHYFHSSLSYRLVTPAGVHVIIAREKISIRHSYLEPDFELLEETGDCSYLHHSSDEPGSEQVSYRAELCLPPECFVLTQQDFINRKRKQAGTLQDDDLLTCEEQERLYGDLAYDRSRLGLTVNERDFERLALFTKGQRISVEETLPRLLHVLLGQEAIAKQIRIDNISARIQNAATEAIVDLSFWRQARTAQFEQELAQALEGLV